MPKLPRFRVYERISKQQVETLMSLQDQNMIRTQLDQLLNPFETVAKFAQQGDSKLEEKAEIVLDFHCINYEFCQAQKFNEKKTATFLEIMHFIFEKCMSDYLPKEKAMLLFKTYCLRHSVQRPPHSLFIFNLNQVKAMTEFVQSTFLKFYSMYQYAIIPKLELELAHDQMFHWDAPEVQELEEAQEVKPKEIPDLQEYFSKMDLERMATPREEAEPEEQPDEQMDPQ